MTNQHPSGPRSAGLVMSVSTTIISLILLLPIAALVLEASTGLFTSTTGIVDSTFGDLVDTVLLQYLQNSLTVVSQTLLFACLFAIAPAWWCAHYSFAGRKYLQWLMVFPLAIPAYISAYIYTDAFDYAGPCLLYTSDAADE